MKVVEQDSIENREIDKERREYLVPSVDHPWDYPKERVHRQKVIRGDRAAHQVYHGLFEDLLN